MVAQNSPRGSEWQKWDLHVHTPKTFLANKFDSCSTADFVNAIVKQDLKVVGLTNYFHFADKELEEIKNKLEEKGITVFPNLEFRTQPQNKDGEEMHIHILFSDKVSITKINNLLGRLKTTDDKYCKDLTQKEIEGTSFAFDALITQLAGDKELKHLEDYLLVASPRGQGSFRPSKSDDGRGNNLAITIDTKTDIIFGSNADTSYFLDLKRYDKAISKPVISTSDAHALKDVGSQFSWVKADPSFEGLKQITYEPEDRVFIGAKPPVTERVESNKTKYINSLQIVPKTDYKNENGIWFKNVNIEFNKELVAIIGNKGSGKSALSDIIGVLGSTHNAGRDNENLSFLNNAPKKRKFRQKGYAENFEATLEWADKAKIKRSLDFDIDVTQKERVKYLPQNYFETLTNDLEGQGFEDTLKSVIFLHIPESKRFSKDNFKELLDFKSVNIEQDISLLRESIKKISAEIIILEDKKHPDYEKEIKSKLEEKQKELDEHKKIEPKEVKDPSKNEKFGEKKKESYEEIEKINQQIETLEKEIKTKEQERLDLSSEKENLSKILSGFERLKGQVDDYIEENKSVLKKSGIEPKELVKFEFKKDLLTTKIKSLSSSIKKIDDLLKSESEIKLESTDPSDQKKMSDGSLFAQKEILQKKISVLKDKLSEPEKKYQEYKEKSKKWEDRKKEIEGDKKNPKKSLDTVSYYEAELDFIKTELTTQLGEKRNKRIKEALKIFAKKKEVLELYNEFKSSIDKRINQDKGALDKFRMNIEVSFKLDKDFYERFLIFVDKRKEGSFYTKKDGEKNLGKIFEEKDFTDEKDINDILVSVILFLENDQREEVKKDSKRNIKDQIIRQSDFYDFIFSLEYIKPNYELRLDDKTLNELSPGEKGALLLVFYLMIDTEDIPLIIDQPEDNLDNQSVFNVLTHFIRSAKKKRQIIVVTHNPNLAVGADAEQIIYVNIDKKGKHKFNYETGAIENPSINKHIVDILEGTMPAFDRRRLKYLRN